LSFSLVFVVVGWIFEIYYLMILVYILLSWLPHLQYTRFARFLRFFVEPYLALFRRFIPPIGIIDLSPMFALLALYFLQRGLYVVLGWIFTSM